jgi:mothers against decapentaplegic homolog 6
MILNLSFYYFVVVFATESTNNCISESSNWCTVAYWEFRSRVGRLPVSDEIIEVFNDAPKSNGLCLSYLPTSDDNNSAKIKKIRQKIGLGIRIRKKDNSVLIYNRSNYPIFLNSSTLEPLNSRKVTVFKLLPGYSIKAFDFDLAMKYLTHPPFLEPSDGPFDINSIRISFVKGWGPNFSRQFITSCPCWLEIIFMVSR